MQLLMVCRATVRAGQTMSLPPSTTTAATQVPAALDSANFRKGRPHTAYRTISFAPAFGNRRCPAPVARLQERNRGEQTNRLESFRVRAETGGDFAKAVVIWTER